MKSLTQNLCIFIAATSLLASTSVQAETAELRGQVNQVLIMENNFGECMVRPELDPQDALPNCKRFYVTMSCDGTHLSPSVGQRLLEQSQVAYALGRDVGIFIDDSRMINGYCLAYRVDTR